VTVLFVSVFEFELDCKQIPNPLLPEVVTVLFVSVFVELDDK
jgi:hypothetical protein